MFSPQRPRACYHVGLLDRDGSVLFSTRADGPSLKSAVPEGHGFVLPVPLDWISNNDDERHFQFVVIETGEVFPETARTLPAARMQGALGAAGTESKEAIKNRYEKAAEEVAFEQDGDLIVLGTHEMTRTGAPLILLEIARRLRIDHGKEIVLLCEGPRDILYAEFAPLCRVIIEDVHTALKVASQQTTYFFRALAKRMNGRTALINSLSSSKLVLACEDVGLPVISLVHEYPYAFPKEWIQRHFDASKHVVFPCSDVRDAYREKGLADTSESRFPIIPQGCYQLDREPLDEGAAAQFKTEFCAGAGVSEDARWVVACGTADARKGFDWFASMLGEYLQIAPEGPDTHFLWIGKVGDEALFFHVNHDLEQSGLLSHFHHLTEQEDIRPALRMADVFLLCSRIDPFPSVVLEAIAHGVPVVGFDRGQGCRGMLEETGFGIVVPYQDRPAAAQAIGQLLDPASDVRAKVASDGPAFVQNRFPFKTYVDRLVTLLGAEAAPAAANPSAERAATITAKTSAEQPEQLRSDAEVTVCVPVYRRGKRLDPTLRSLAEQTYTDFDVLIGLEPEDDGGETLAVCEKYVRADDRFHLIENSETLGWGGNIRSLMGRVTTPFFMVLPHDDALHAECLEQLVQAARENGDASVIYPDIYFFGHVDGRQVVTTRDEEPEQRLFRYFHSGGDPEFWKGLTRRALLEDGDAFPVHGERSFAAEYEWALRLLLRGKIARVATPLYYKRIHDAESDSVSTHWLHRLSDTERLRELRAHGERMRRLACHHFQSERLAVACDLAWLRRVLEFSDGMSEFMPEEVALLKAIASRIDRLDEAERAPARSCLEVLQARQFMAAQKFELAEQGFRDALDSWSGNREASLLLVKALLRQSKTDEALTRFIEFEDALPQSAPDWRSGELIGWISSQLKHRLGR